jgi:molybdate transport system substrate-binding protein
MPDLRILSGGAAHGLVQALTPAFAEATGYGIAGDFGAVGGMRKRVMDGEAVDCVILTRAILAELGSLGLVEPASIRDIGGVATAIAVREGDAPPACGDAAALRDALLAADAIYFPDPELATAGIHFRNVMANLGILQEVNSRLRTFPNGATAMKALAAAPGARPIGCTQATEIVATPGVHLVEDLPGAHALVTIYTAGRARASAHGSAADTLISLLTAPEAAATRRACAFRG